jgi:hypothetical protein
MRLNVFEGARRLTYLMLGIWLVGWGIAAFTNEPYLRATYLIPEPGAQPIPLGDSSSCKTNDRKEWTSVQTKKGRTVHLELCFMAVKSLDGDFVVPTEIDPKSGYLTGWPPYSTNVDTYVKAAAAKFKLPVADDEEMDKRYWPEKWRQIKEGGRWAGGGVLAIWIASVIVGWIVRGFMGIPWGQDRRLDAPAKE